MRDKLIISWDQGKKMKGILKTSGRDKNRTREAAPS